jgi:hypothetical protein
MIAMQNAQPTQSQAQQGASSKDWFLVGGAAGSIATMVRGLLDYLFYVSGASDVRFPDIAGGAVLGLRSNRPRTTAEQSIGYVADAAFGGLFGASLALLLRNTPTRNPVLKGSLFGVGLWAATFSLGALLKIDGLANPSPKSTAASFVSTTVYGGIVGYLIDRFDRRTVIARQDKESAGQSQERLHNTGILDTDVVQDGRRYSGSPQPW